MSISEVDDQLRQTLKLEAFSQLAGGIAHDFNNLLTVITGYAETLLLTFDAGDSRVDDVNEIRRAAERASWLTQQLLAFSRKQVLRPDLVDLNTIVDEAAPMLTQLMGPAVECRVTRAPVPAVVTADRAQIEHVLLNLAVNAREAMPDGGVLHILVEIVEVSPENAAPRHPLRAGRFVRLTVSDTGVGMTEEVRARAFEPFFTAKGTGERAGLGLSTVHGIVEQSGGLISLESRPGRGSVFEIYLPFTATGDPAAAPDTGEGTGSGSTILLVDDYHRIRELARKVLLREGYRVLDAGSAAEAIAVAETHRGAIDLLLTDVAMPGQSGPELARQLLRGRPGMAVIYMSGYAGDSHDALAAGDAPFIRKPFTPKVLAQAVRAVLAQAPLRRGTGA